MLNFHERVKRYTGEIFNGLKIKNSQDKNQYEEDGYEDEDEYEYAEGISVNFK